MKNLLKFLGLIMIAGMVMVSCESDPVVSESGPNVTISSTASVLDPGESFTVSVNATAGDAEMNSFVVIEDGIQLAPSRITEIVGLATVNNPALLFDGDRASFTFDVTLTASTDPGDHTYSFRVVDANVVSTTEDLFVSVRSTPATITYVGDMTIPNVAPGSLVSLQLDVVQGTFPMSTIAVYENGELIADASRLELGSTEFDANPFTLAVDQKDAFSEMLFIRVPDTAGANAYSIVISDEGGETATLDINVETGTALTELQGVLFNAGGGQNTGGLDLDDGISTNSSDAIAEIKDLGIDTDLAADINWIQRITGVNGFEARYLFGGQNGLPENFTFEGVSYKEQLPDLWDNSTPFTSEDVSTGEKVSFLMEVGDVFIVSDGVKFYTLIVREVNVRPMASDNSDNYVLDIKY